ncbi:MAG: GrpB family protein [Flavobacteriales bacterium]|nr:GrpB family protein [Flavobacteriales bacterium]MBP6699014.1 GrpB family protein [Flavobacteriales bacterium]MBP7407794.1 GrpB family protein [Flavobacteriales bacterium]
MAGTTKDRISALDRERIAIAPYDANWPLLYTEIEKQIKQMVPRQLMQRISHIGSTAVPGLSGKPIVDVQVEVNDLERVRETIAPLMEEAGYEFFWRPTMGDAAPFYAWFILRNEAKERIAHVHMVESGQASADRIVFRDYLRSHPEESARYEALKQDLAKRFPKDRASYTANKGSYVSEVLRKARGEKMRK